MRDIGIIIIIVIILYFIYKYYGESFSEYIPHKIKHNNRRDRFSEYNTTPLQNTPRSWGQSLRDNQITPDIKARHQADMVDVTPIYSSGAGYSEVEQDNNNPAFTQWRGFTRPDYIPLLPDARQLPDIDIEQMKNFHTISWGPRARL